MSAIKAPLKIYLSCQNATNCAANFIDYNSNFSMAFASLTALRIVKQTTRIFMSANMLNINILLA